MANNLIKSVSTLSIGCGIICAWKIIIKQYKDDSIRLVENVQAAGTEEGGNGETEGIHVDPLSDMDLKCVQIFFRHGARTPTRQITGTEVSLLFNQNKLKHQMTKDGYT